jgi:hypothetical protein
MRDLQVVVPLPQILNLNVNPRILPAEGRMNSTWEAQILEGSTSLMSKIF